MRGRAGVLVKCKYISHKNMGLFALREFNVVRYDIERHRYDSLIFLCG